MKSIEALVSRQPRVQPRQQFSGDHVVGVGEVGQFDHRLANVGVRNTSSSSAHGDIGPPANIGHCHPPQPAAIDFVLGEEIEQRA